MRADKEWALFSRSLNSLHKFVDWFIPRVGDHYLHLQRLFFIYKKSVSQSSPISDRLNGQDHKLPHCDLGVSWISFDRQYLFSRDSPIVWSQSLLQFSLKSIGD